MLFDKFYVSLMLLRLHCNATFTLCVLILIFFDFFMASKNFNIFNNIRVKSGAFLKYFVATLWERIKVIVKLFVSEQKLVFVKRTQVSCELMRPVIV